MKKDKTLREICSEVGVSRRAVQGYEKVGLVHASGRNKYGHLLYDKEAEKRIEEIKLYQDMGFKIKEIKTLMNASETERKVALQNRVLSMKEEQKKKERLIQRAYEMIAAMEV